MNKKAVFILIGSAGMTGAILGLLIWSAKFMIMSIDAAFFVGGSMMMSIIFMAMLLWGIKTGQFEDMEKMRSKPIEEEKIE